MTIKADQQDALQRAALIMVLLNAFTTPLMLSAVNVALPSIASDLKLDAVMLSWIPMGYLMASAMFVLAFGRLADMYGRKRVFLAGTTSVIVTSLIAAVATSGEWLVGARFLQGMSAAMLYATQMAIVSSVFPPAKRGHAIGLTVSMIYLGLAGGPLIGGFLIDQFGWRASFIFYIPLAVIVLIIGLLKVPGEWSADERGSFDLRGAILYGVAVAAFCTAVSLLPRGISFVLLGASLLGIWVFFHLARRTHHPIFDVSLFFSNRVFSLSCIAAYIIYTAIFANVILISLYLQYLKGISASHAIDDGGPVAVCRALFRPHRASHYRLHRDGNNRSRVNHADATQWRQLHDIYHQRFIDYRPGVQPVFLTQCKCHHERSRKTLLRERNGIARYHAPARTDEQHGACSPGLCPAHRAGGDTTIHLSKSSTGNTDCLYTGSAFVCTRDCFLPGTRTDA
jgi:MFS family permease